MPQSLSIIPTRHHDHHHLIAIMEAVVGVEEEEEEEEEEADREEHQPYQAGTPIVHPQVPGLYHSKPTCLGGESSPKMIMSPLLPML